MCNYYYVNCTGLFNQYIIQSGSPLTSWAYKDKKYFIEYAKRISEHVSCQLSSPKFVECLQNKSLNILLNTNSIFSELDVFADFAQIWWTATNELPAEGAFLTDSPRNLIEQNKMKDLPVMTGVLTDEGLLNTASEY